MSKITIEQIEESVRRLLNGETTKRQLIKELDTSMRTLNNEITKLSLYNAELYKKYVDKFPYKPKEIVVDIETLAVRVITNGLQETSKQTGISVRTISRKVKTLEKTNPELYSLYANRSKPMTDEERVKFNAKVSEFYSTKPITRNEIDEKERELTTILQDFEEKVQSGMSKAQAARELGFDGYPTIYKKYKELDRLRVEKETRETDKPVEKTRKRF